jgi:hypothetical protein
LANIEWKISKDRTSTISFTINSEKIEGKEKEVLNVKQNMSSGTSTDSRFAYVLTTELSIVEKLAKGSGVRFKILGDGKTWELTFPTKETSVDYNFYKAPIATIKNKVVDIDIPYSKLKQGSWGKKTAFNKNSISELNFGRTWDTPGGFGTTAIKIFDLEIY